MLPDSRSSATLSAKLQKIASVHPRLYVLKKRLDYKRF
jgi:hypothetical protein